ncbi:T9SS type A sorting domain-containing protein [bacterium]|nr:T9SS type A sorting domain-containing protein [bacterium]
MRLYTLYPFLIVVFMSTAIAQTLPPCEPLRYFNPTGQTLAYTEAMPTSWWAVRMSVSYKTDVDSAFVGFGVARATTSGLTPDTLDLRVLKDQLPQQVILDQFSLLIPPNLQGNVPDAYYIVEFQVDDPTARVYPTPADFWLSWRLRGPSGDVARILLRTPADNPRRSVTIGSAGDTTLATLVVKNQLGLARQDSVDLWAEARVCYPDGYPVELQSFTARYTEGQAQLSWSTASEENNMGFHIERLAASSAAGPRIWQQIGFVQGHGSTSMRKDYQFIDEHPDLAAQEDGSVVYRLRQVDFDGTNELSPTVEIHVPRSTGFLMAQNYPNPASIATGMTTVALQMADAGTLQLDLYDALGRKIRTVAEGQYAKGRHFIEVSLDGLVPGTYFYRLSAGAHMEMRRMSLTR